MRVRHESSLNNSSVHVLKLDDLQFSAALNILETSNNKGAQTRQLDISLLVQNVSIRALSGSLRAHKFCISHGLNESDSATTLQG